MTTLSPENHVEIVKSFFKNRPMKIHWIQIPDEIRDLLTNRVELLLYLFSPNLSK